MDAKAARTIKLLLLLALFAVPASAQNSPYSDIALSAAGRPIAGAGISVCNSPGLATTAASVSSNLVTLTMSSNPITAGFAANMTLQVSGFTGGDTYLNGGTLSGGVITGGFTILSVTSTTIVYQLTHANASATSNGFAFQQGNISTPCAPLGSITSDQAGLVPITQPGLASDNLGNYAFFAVANNYVIQYNGPGIFVRLKPVAVPCAGSASCTFTGPQSFTNLTASGTTTLNNPNNTFHVGGNTTLTLAQGLSSCPAGIGGCHIIVDGNLTVTSGLTYSTAGSPLEIECVNPTAVNGNSGGTLVTFTPAAASNFLSFSSQTRVIIKGCNFTQSNSLLPTTSGITNITWSAGTATANCSGTGANCANISVGQIVNITGNAQLNTNSVTNYPVTVTAIGSGTFSFQYPNSSTATGGTAQPLPDAFQMNGIQGLRLVDSQISGFPGVGMHIIDISGTSSAEYGEIENSHISFNGVNLAYTVVPPAGAQSANAHTLIDSVVGGASILNIMTTGGAAEIVYLGGENSDGGKNLQVLDRFGDGVTSCRGPYFLGVTMESNNTAPSGQLGIDNRCQGADIHWEGGLGVATAQLIADGTGPGGICHWAWRTGASTSANEPSTPFSESTCPGMKWDSSGDISLNGAAIIPGGGNISGVAALYTGGNNTWLFSSSLIASGAQITALYPSSATTTLGKSGSGAWTSLFLGTGATNNFQFVPAATAAARTVSMPDPGTNVNLAFNLTATSSAFATATTAGTCVQNTTAVAGATTSMAVSISPVSTPGVGAVWSAFVSSAGNVTINECAVATSAGGTIAFNIRVTP